MIKILASVLVLALFIYGVGFYGNGSHALFPSLRLLRDTQWDFSLFWALGAQKALAFFLLIPITLGFLGWAGLFQDLLFPRVESGPAKWIGFSISLSFFSLYVLGLGLNEILYGPLVFLFFVPAFKKGWMEWRALNWAGFRKKAGLLWLALPALFWLSEYFSGPIVWDAVLDHFRYAEEVSRLHQVLFHWTNHTGDMPKAAELILGGFWSMGGEGLSRLSSALPAFGTTALLFLFSKEWKGSGTPAYWIFGTCPFFLAIFSWGYVEGFLAFWEGMALYALWKSLEQTQNKLWPCLTMFFLGMAFTVKYTAVFSILALAILWLYGRFIRRLNLKLGWAPLAFFALPAFPWLLKNGLAFHNPLYPLATSVFGTDYGYGPGMEKDLWQDTGLPQGLGFGGRVNLLWKVFFTPDNAVAAVWTPLVFMALPWSWKALKSRLGIFLSLFAGVFFLEWMFFCTSLRHASGGGLVLVLLAAMAWEAAFQGNGTGPKVLFGIGTAFSLWLCLSAQLNCTAPYASALGLEDNLLRLKRHYSLSLDTYCAYRDIEQNSDPRDKVVAFGVFQTYPLQRTAYVDFAWKNPIFLQWASNCKTAGQLALLLRREGAAFFLYQKAEAEDLFFRSRKFQLNGMPLGEYKKFWRLYATPISIYDNSIVYRLNAESDPKKNGPLLELPGLEERDFGEMDRDLFHQQPEEAYKIISTWVWSNPDVAEGLARRSRMEAVLGLCGRSVESGVKAWNGGLRDTDMCLLLSECFGKLKQPEIAGKWQTLGLRHRDLTNDAIARALTYYRSIP